MARMRRERATTDTFILSVGSQAPGEAGRTQSPSLLIIHTGPSALDSDHSRVGGGGETTVLPWCLLKGRAWRAGSGAQLSLLIFASARRKREREGVENTCWVSAPFRPYFT